MDGTPPDQEAAPPEDFSRVNHWTEVLDQRMRAEIVFARVYATQFNHGTTGHNSYLVINEMARLLDNLFNLTRMQGGLLQQLQAEQTNPDLASTA